MSKKILLIIGAVTVVGLLIFVWIYVMFIGTPRSIPNIADTFNFDFGEDPPVTTEDQFPVTPTADPTINLERKPLRQLTTRPVIGYREILSNSTSSGPILLYAEAGTGHVYSIDLLTGTEVRLSGTTIIEAAEAVFSTDGNYVVYRSGYNRMASTLLGTLILPMTACVRQSWVN